MSWASVLAGAVTLLRVIPGLARVLPKPGPKVEKISEKKRAS